jgi:hypothetical protein
LKYFKNIKEKGPKMAGRYTLKQALTTLCDNVEIDNPALAMRLLVANIKIGSIPVYEPGHSIPIKKPKSVDENYEEVEWIDLNRFVNGLKVLSSWRFPDPSTQENLNGVEDKNFNSYGWRLNPLARQDTFRSELYLKLKKAYLANEPIPNPVDLINEWRVQKPNEFHEVTAEYVKFYGRNGAMKEADIKIIGARINRLIAKKTT